MGVFKNNKQKGIRITCKFDGGTKDWATATSGRWELWWGGYCQLLVENPENHTVHITKPKCTWIPDKFYYSATDLHKTIIPGCGTRSELMRLEFPQEYGKEWTKQTRWHSFGRG